MLHQLEPIEYSRRQYLEYDLIMDGIPWYLAKEAVATTAIEHPDWDLDEMMTWDAWGKNDSQ